VNLATEDLEILQAGKEYSLLREHPGYKRVLSYIERLADSALAAMRQSVSTDPEVIANLCLRWREREYILSSIEREVATGIEQRRDILAAWAGGDEYDETEIERKITEENHV